MDNSNLIEKFVDFLNEYYKDELVQAANEGKKSINVDFSKLEQFDVDIADYLLENPAETIPTAQKAVKQIDVGYLDEGFRLRFFNLPENRNIRIRNVRAEHIGKLIVVDGIVRRASEVRPEVSEAIFQCVECGSNMTMIQVERTIRPPMECENPACKNRRAFRLVDQRLYDARWLVFEEPFEIVESEKPSTLRVYLKEDLTVPKMQNKTDPGNRIKVTGVIKQLPVRMKGTVQRQMDIFLDANYVESVEAEWDEVEIKPEQEQQIIELAKSPDVYEKLVKSIAPTIYGHDHIKLAIALQLFGGERHIQTDRSRVRGDIHLLLIGDPSTAKSVLMKVTSTLIPRGRYVSGKGVTQAGLTASVVKDEEFLGGWVLEAGALVLSNRSMIAIDEFEKIEKTDQVALHEAMEQQTISIAKATIVATLPAQTAVLGGGNPKLGRFDPYVPIKEQVDIPETLLTRFDLKFALRDIPNAERDLKVAEHILKARHFSEDTEEVKPEIDPEFLRKYIAYARKNCHPKLTHESADAIKNFYLELRQRSREDSPISITPRQYEALIRMAESSAKIQLRDLVTVEDALRGIDLMNESLREFGLELETGEIDIDKVEGASATSLQRNKIRHIRDIIDDLEKNYEKGEIPKDEIIRISMEQNIKVPEEILAKMQLEGYIFSPRPGVISKVK
ncbi:MAG: minichromosome maintenance protein MCM [Candidatus Aenigmarchaeota archaeon]|nr:minichromosome maintenance protein MCM [Candidatus Aenigmarchaeota archaeon]